MTYFCKLGTVVLMVVCCCAAMAADLGEMRFKRLSLEQGLSQSSVQALVQDSKGFVWIGTADGLNRYDGDEIKIYKHDPTNPQSIAGNDIYSLFIDSKNRMWVGGRSSGLSLYEPEYDRFQVWRHDPIDSESLSSNWIMSMVEDRDGGLWIGTQSGLSHISESGAITRTLIHQPNEAYSRPGPIPSLMLDQSGRLWAGSYQGLALYDREKRQFELIEFKDAVSNDSQVWSIIEDRFGMIWFGGNDGLKRLNPETREIRHYVHDPEDPNSLSDSAIWSLLYDADDRILIGTHYGGLNIFDGTRFKKVTRRKEDVTSLSQDAIRSMMQDKDGGLWLGSYSSGVNYYNPQISRFKHLQHNPSGSGLSDPMVMSILQSSYGELWVGSFGGGLDRFDASFKRTHSYKADKSNENALTTNDVTALYEDREGRLWIGGDDGYIHEYDRERDSFSRRTVRVLGVNSRAPAPIKGFVEDKKGRFWVISYGGGLHRLNRITGSLQHYPLFQGPHRSLSHQHLISIAVDDDGYIWTGSTETGLVRFNPNNGAMNGYLKKRDDVNSLSHNRVNAIFPEEGKVWIGTYGGGLNLLDPETGHFEVYRESDGLANGVVYGILSDASGRLWMSTNRGLSCFNRTNGHFINYDSHDGLQSNEFNTNAWCAGPNGMFFFGGVNGVSAFDPDLMEPSGSGTPMMITKISVNNNPLAPSGIDPSSPLEKAPEYAKSLVLDHHERLLGFEFTALSFSHPDKIRYAYMLKGFDKEWVYTDHRRRSVTYAALPAGDYTFKVKGSGEDGVWSEQQAALHVKINPPPWLSPWAYVVYVIFVGLLVMAFFHYQRRKLTNERKINEMLETQVNQRTRELAAKNRKMGQQLRELETLERLVKVVNSEVRMSDVVPALLEQSRELFPEVDSVVFLTMDPDHEHYRFTASIGVTFADPKIRFSKRLTVSAWRDKAQMMGRGVFRAQNLGDADKIFAGINVKMPRDLIILSLDQESGRLLALCNQEKNCAFDNLDVRRLGRFREHAINAVSKAQAFEELVEAQRELTLAAHSAGMAEIASNVLHNVGNILNSVKISAHMIENHVQDTDSGKLLQRVAGLLESQKEDLPGFFANDSRAKAIPNAMRQIGEVVMEQNQVCERESRRLLKHIRTIMEVLQEQRRHTELSHGLLEMVDINQVIRDTIQIEKPYLYEHGVNVVYDLPEIAQVQLDRTRLIRILFYVLKHTCELMGKERRGSIVARSRIFGKFVRVDFIAEGCEVDTDHNLFFSHGFNEGDKFKGFGLHYCANVMREMSGKIEVGPCEENKGAAITLFFPNQTTEVEHHPEAIHQLVG